MKNYIKIIGILFFVGILAGIMPINAYAEGENDKACVLTVASPDSAQIECKGEGTICSTNQECYRVFNPNIQ
jgi:hypothetical protein